MAIDNQTLAKPLLLGPFCNSLSNLVIFEHWLLLVPLGAALFLLVNSAIQFSNRPEYRLGFKDGAEEKEPAQTERSLEQSRSIAQVAFFTDGTGLILQEDLGLLVAVLTFAVATLMSGTVFSIVMALIGLLCLCLFNFGGVLAGHNADSRVRLLLRRGVALVGAVWVFGLFFQGKLPYFT